MQNPVVQKNKHQRIAPGQGKKTGQAFKKGMRAAPGDQPAQGKSQGNEKKGEKDIGQRHPELGQRYPGQGKTEQEGGGERPLQPAVEILPQAEEKDSEQDKAQPGEKDEMDPENKSQRRVLKRVQERPGQQLLEQEGNGK